MSKAADALMSSYRHPVTHAVTYVTGEIYRPLLRFAMERAMRDEEVSDTVLGRTRVESYAMWLVTASNEELRVDELGSFLSN